MQVKKIIFGLLLVASGAMLGITGMWAWMENIKPKTHKDYCLQMAQDYLASIKDKLKVTDYEWEWGVKNETKMFNLCLEDLNKVDLGKYEIEKLKIRGGIADQIVLGEITTSNELYEVRLFEYQTDGKKVTGVATIPNDCTAENKCPVIVQFRGYIDQATYKPGDGTKHSAEMLAAAGFISLAPDYLGYGRSDMPSVDIFEERFSKYTTGLDLLASVGSLPMVDTTRVGVWGHSNGGQVALTLLTTGIKYPTVLWAPVSARFPYSILYFTEDIPDGGLSLRKEVARLDEDFGSDKFWFGGYLDNVSAPIQLHQGTSDDQVPVVWSRNLVKKLRTLDKDIEYFEYPGADHNLTPNWTIVMDKSIEFFRNNLR